MECSVLGIGVWGFTFCVSISDCAAETPKKSPKRKKRLNKPRLMNKSRLPPSERRRMRSGPQRNVRRKTTLFW